MRFAQISDLHFGSVTLNPFQFFSKRWLGNSNYFFKRKKEFNYDRLIELIAFFKKNRVTHVVITGDLSVTSRKKEFKKAKKFVQLLKDEGFTVFTIPGNHDHYTKKSYRKKHFYRFFDAQFDPKCPYNLKDHKVTYTKLKEGLWLLAIDTALATSWISSQGSFTPQTEEILAQACKQIPKQDKIIVVNHFPFFQSDPVYKQLLGAPLLRNFIQKQPNVSMYLHGHTHRQAIADLRESDLPIISDCGSTPHGKNGACHLFHFEDNTLELTVYRYDGSWKESKKHVFIL